MVNGDAYQFKVNEYSNEIFANHIYTVNERQIVFCMPNNFWIL